jgi:hypothetical protein
MNAARRGHRDAAQGIPTNPFDFTTHPTEHDAWVDAAAVVVKNQKDGRDPNGHAPPPPHLCTRDVAKVCNCCSDCQAVCWVEGVVEKGRSLVRKVLGG